MQGAFGLEAAEIMVVGNTLSFHVPVTAGVYEGLFDPATKTIKGTWTQRGMGFPLNFQWAGNQAAPALSRPQTPKPTLDYMSLEATFAGPEPGTTISGVMTQPIEKGFYPALILLSGSGTQDSDHTVMGHKTFLVLADFLTRNGYVVLRMDDRGGGLSTGDPKAGLEGLAGDVRAAYEVLTHNPWVDKSRISLLGISQGGMVAARASVEIPEIDKVVLLSTPLRGLKEVTVYQSEALNLASGATPAQAKANAALQQEIMLRLSSGPTPEEAGAKVKEFLLSIGMPEDRIAPQVAAMITPAYYSFVNYDPAADLTNTGDPVLAIYGSKDLQVSAKANTAIIKEMNQTRAPIIKTVTFDSLNHLLQTAETGLVQEYGEIEETISPEVLDTILEWLEKDE